MRGTEVNASVRVLPVLLLGAVAGLAGCNKVSTSNRMH